MCDRQICAHHRETLDLPVHLFVVYLAENWLKHVPVYDDTASQRIVELFVASIKPEFNVTVVRVVLSFTERHYLKRMLWTFISRLRWYCLNRHVSVHGLDKFSKLPPPPPTTTTPPLFNFWALSVFADLLNFRITPSPQHHPQLLDLVSF